MSTPETQEPNSIYLNMDSDAFLQGTSVNSRLSLPIPNPQSPLFFVLEQKN